MSSTSQTEAENLTEFFGMGWVDILGKLSTPLIAIFVAYVAYQQWQTNRGNLKERLFDRRMEVFEKFQAGLVEGTLDVPPPELTNQLSATAMKARFLFGEEIQALIHEAAERTLKIRQLERRIARPTDNETFQDLSDKIDGHRDWLHQTRSSVFTTFAPYLEFSKHRD